MFRRLVWRFQAGLATGIFPQAPTFIPFCAKQKGVVACLCGGHINERFPVGGRRRLLSSLDKPQMEMHKPLLVLHLKSIDNSFC
jgi:hypothetical protein